jgi:hypothetical protein
MAKYHINPATGNVGVCQAKRNCPFGESHHFLTQNEALKQSDELGEAYFEFYQQVQSFKPLTKSQFTQELIKQYPKNWKNLLELTSFTELNQASMADS